MREVPAPGDTVPFVARRRLPDREAELTVRGQQLRRELAEARRENLRLLLRQVRLRGELRELREGRR